MKNITRLFALISFIWLAACEPSAYTEDGKLIVPGPPSSIAMAEEAPIDRALQSRIRRFDIESKLDTVGFATLATAILCRAAECSQSNTAEVFLKGTAVAVASAGYIPTEDVTLLQSRENTKLALARVNWIEGILEISNAYVLIAQRDAEVLKSASFDTASWAALYETRITTLTEAIDHMAPQVRHLREVATKTRFPQTKPEYRRLATRARSAFEETKRNRDRLQAVAAQFTEISQ